MLLRRRRRRLLLLELTCRFLRRRLPGHTLNLTCED
jgi:hypothetical protein